MQTSIFISGIFFEVAKILSKENVKNYLMDRMNKLLEMLKNEPQDAFLQHALALEYIKCGDDEKAKDLFENILKTDPAYVGSYYHLGKLLERNGETTRAQMVYETGIGIASKAGDFHAAGELRSALDALE
jgi:Tfp pilus assembly protein PilF